MVIILDDGSSEELKMSVAQVQVDYQTKKQYMVANILKYGSDNLIILYCYAYSRLLGITKVVIHNSMRSDKECRYYKMDYLLVCDI